MVSRECSAPGRRHTNSSQLQLICSEPGLGEPEGSIFPLSPFTLPYFPASLFATILEDTITELRILLESNSELSLMKAHVDMEALRARKFSVAPAAARDDLAGVHRRALACTAYKVNKLDADRQNIHQFLVKTYKGLTVARTFECLVSIVKEIIDKINYYNFLVEDEAKNRITRRELCKQLRQRRNYIKTVFYDTDCAIEDLKSKVEDAALNAEIRSRYVSRWQRARSEQHAARAAQRERPCAAALERHKHQLDTEQRVHMEVELLVSISINETLEKVESWMNKYDKDMEAVELKIQRMRTNHITMVEKREELEKTIEKHAQLMTEWIDFKDKREKARLYREKMTNAAITVQAWWRGLLVRNQLGPYKPAKGKKAKPADAKKK